MRDKLAGLGLEDAISAVKEKAEDGTRIFFRSGVWNPYKQTTLDDAVRQMEHAPYGSDVWYDEDEDAVYISRPCQADMW